ncbi:MAG: sigma-70 family RNA polymerase sigma factor [Nocardioides sp.]
MASGVAEPGGGDREVVAPAGGAAREANATVWAEATAGFRLWDAGDEAGLDQLVAAMTPVLWHVVRAFRLTTEQSEDIIQTTWLALVRNRAKILDPAAVGGWLTTTARREAWRVAKVGTRSTPTEDDELTFRLPKQRSAEQTVVADDEDARLWAAVRTLDERCQMLLRIVAFEHRPDYKLIAADLGMPVGSVGPTRGRCLDKLKTALAAAAFVEEVPHE